MEVNIGAHGRTTGDMLAAVGEPRLPKGYNATNDGGLRHFGKK